MESPLQVQLKGSLETFLTYFAKGQISIRDQQCSVFLLLTISIKINCMDTELHIPYPIGSIKSVGWNVCKFPVLTETHCILETYEWMAWGFFCLVGFFWLKDSFKMLYFLSFLLPPFLSVSSVFFSIKSLQLSFKSNLSEFSRGDTEERKPKGRKKMCFCCGFFRLLVFLSLMPAL